MTAFAAVKHSYRKEGDHWVAKREKGPSDPQAARGPTTSQKSTDPDRAQTAGGKQVPVDEWSRDALYDLAQDLAIAGRSKMSKGELLQAVKKRR